MKLEPITCLIIDDTLDVLKGLENELTDTLRFCDAGQVITRDVHITKVHIRFSSHPTSNPVKVDKDVLDSLTEAVERQPEFILTDFAFVADEAQNDKIRHSFNGTAAQLLTACSNSCSFLPMLIDSDPGLRLAFSNYKGTVALYTHSAPPFDRLFDPSHITDRINELQRAFPKATIETPYNAHPKLKRLQERINPLTGTGGQQQTNLLVKGELTHLLAKHLHGIIWGTCIQAYFLSKTQSREKILKSLGFVVAFVGIMIGSLTSFLGDLIWRFVQESLMKFDKVGVSEGLQALVIPAVLLAVGVVAIALLAYWLGKRIDALISSWFNS